MEVRGVPVPALVQFPATNLATTSSINRNNITFANNKEDRIHGQGLKSVFTSKTDG